MTSLAFFIIYRGNSGVFLRIFSLINIYYFGIYILEGKYLIFSN